MDKLYKFEVAVNQGNDNTVDDFVESLLSEINEDKIQYEISSKINQETSKVHKNILEDIKDDLDNAFKKLGLGSLCTELIRRNGTNDYTPMEFRFELVNRYTKLRQLHSVGMHVNSDRNFKDSKFCTFTGDFSIKVEYTNSSGYTLISKEDNIVSKVLEFVREDIKAMLKDS